MFPHEGLPLVLLAFLLPSPLTGQAVRRTQPPVVAFALVLDGVQAGWTLPDTQVARLADEAADSVGFALAPFDLTRATLLPDTMLVVQLHFGPDRSTFQLDARWLVAASRFTPSTRRSRTPLRLACPWSVISAATHAAGASDEWLRQGQAAAVRRAIGQTLACFRRET